MSKHYSFEEKSSASGVGYNKQGNRMARLVIKYSGGLIRNNKQAAVFLLCVALIGLVLTVYFISDAVSGPPPVEPGVNSATGERLPGENG